MRSSMMPLPHGNVCQGELNLATAAPLNAIG